jgi:hypothetical protein
MGVDYTANFGLGYKIECPINEQDENSYIKTPDDGVMSDMFDFARYVKKSSEYFLIETGNTYSGESEWYIIIKNPFAYGLNLINVCAKLTDYCRHMGFEIIGNFGCHGGLRIS